MQAESTITAPGGGVHRVNATSIPISHVGAAAAPFFWSRRGAASAALLYRLAGSLGTGVGYHRLPAHRGFRTPEPVEYFPSVCGMLAPQESARHGPARYEVGVNWWGIRARPDCRDSLRTSR